MLCWDFLLIVAQIAKRKIIGNSEKYRPVSIALLYDRCRVDHCDRFIKFKFNDIKFISFLSIFIKIKLKKKNSNFQMFINN